MGLEQACLWPAGHSTCQNHCDQKLTSQGAGCPSCWLYGALKSSLVAGLGCVLCLAANGLDPWPPAPPCAPSPLVMHRSCCLSYSPSHSSAPLSSKHGFSPARALQSIKLFSLLSKALFVQFEPDGIIVTCTCFA